MQMNLFQMVNKCYPLQLSSWGDEHFCVLKHQFSQNALDEAAQIKWAS
jgi:hypothetical protein